MCDLVLLEGQLAGGQECLVALLDGEGEVPVEHLQVPLQEGGTRRSGGQMFNGESPNNTRTPRSPVHVTEKDSNSGAQEYKRSQIVNLLLERFVIWTISETFILFIYFLICTFQIR